MPIVNLFDLHGKLVQKREKYIDREAVVGIPRMAFGIVGIFSDMSLFTSSANRILVNLALNRNARSQIELEEDLRYLNGINISPEVDRTVTNAYEGNNVYAGQPIYAGQPVYITGNGVVSSVSTSSSDNSNAYFISIDVGTTTDYTHYQINSASN